MKNADVETETEFPLSVDPTTKTLTVTTPSGVKTVTVLPNQAIANMLANHAVNEVETDPSTGIKQIILTEVNNEPTFEIKGRNNKHLFGVFPVSVPKTLFVSAQTGQVVQTDENLGGKILEVISF